MTDHRLLSDADLEPVSDAQLQAAIAVVAAMDKFEFQQAAIKVGLIPERKPKPRVQRKRTALVRVVPYGATFGAECGWCGWVSAKRLTFHAAQLQAHSHNRHAHRDHCIVEARVA